jgi:hypothetical protein
MIWQTFSTLSEFPFSLSAPTAHSGRYLHGGGDLPRAAVRYRTAGHRHQAQPGRARSGKAHPGTVANLTTTQREVQDAEGRWRSLEIRPYRTTDNRIEGAVLALPDMDRVKHRERYLKQIIDNVPNPLLVLDGELKILLAI